MKRTLLASVALFALSTVALASSLPRNGAIVVNDSNGAIVGTGTIANGQLTLALDPSAASSLVMITVTTSQGASLAYQAMVDSSGQVIVVHDNQFQDLAGFAQSSGIDRVSVTEAPQSLASGTVQTESKASDPSSDATADSPDSTSGTDASSTETEKKSSAGDDKVDVGTSLDTGTSSTDVDTSEGGTASKDD